MSTETALDRTDFEILEALQKNARLSNKELAARVNLAPSSCLERVRRLRADGVLGGFHASVATHAMGIGLQALIAVRIRLHARELVEEFHAHILEQKPVISLYHLAGANDYLIHVAVSDADELRNFVLDAIATREEVEHMETNLIFGHDKKWVLPNYRAGE